MSCALPSTRVGRPTTSPAGFHSSINGGISAKPWMLRSGCAVPSSGSPTATPMRLRPKSKARTVVAARSGMSRFVLQPPEVDAEKLHRRRQPLLGRRLEDDAVGRLHREPGVLRELVLELPGRPAGVAQR